MSKCLSIKCPIIKMTKNPINKMFKCPINKMSRCPMYKMSNIIYDIFKNVYLHLGHVSQNTEDDESRNKTGKTVYRTGY